MYISVGVHSDIIKHQTWSDVFAYIKKCFGRWVSTSELSPCCREPWSNLHYYEDDINCGNTNFKWRYDRHSGNCNLSKWKLIRKKNSGLQRIPTHGLCVSAALLYQLSYEEPYHFFFGLICSSVLDFIGFHNFSNQDPLIGVRPSIRSLV